MTRFEAIPERDRPLKEGEAAFRGTGLSASTLEDAKAESEALPFPDGAAFINVIDRDKQGQVVHKVWKPLNA